MKVLLINGSPHIHGCTHRALSEVSYALNADGIDTEIIHIGNQPIRGCQACGMCRKSNLGLCIFGDDPVNVIIKKMEKCDAMIVGSPVHFAGPTGAMTSLMDRLFYATLGFPHKLAASVVTCRRAGATTALDQLNKYFMFNNMPVISSVYWNMAFGNTPQEIEQDQEGLLIMRTLGHNMAYYLKAMEAASIAGIQPPVQEEIVRTNFIRELKTAPAEIPNQNPEYKNFAPYFTSYNKVNKAYQDED